MLAEFSSSTTTNRTFILLHSMTTNNNIDDEAFLMKLDNNNSSSVEAFQNTSISYVSNYSYKFNNSDGDDEDSNNKFYIITSILLISCLVAMIVNVIVIASARWIRCSMTPNLKISLSLAAADAASSTLYGLPFVYDFIDDLGIFPYFLEIFRLSGMVITVIHLLALSLNHYIGILKPLHYNSIVTSKKVTALIWLLWLVPFSVILLMCAIFDLNGNFWFHFIHNMDYNPDYLNTFMFRMSFSFMFIIPITIMVICYTHILIVVKQQQIRWNNLSRVGSTRIQGKPNQKMSRERIKLEGNVRAIYTTLLILGSCFIGWTPGLLIYTITCSSGCLISGDSLIKLNRDHINLVVSLRLIDNILIILKMLLNPIIYSIRMREIKDGTHRMYLAITGLFCKSRRDNFQISGYYYRSRLQNSIGGGTIQVRVTSMKNNNDGNQHLNGVEENTLL